MTDTYKNEDNVNSTFHVTYRA